MLESKMTKAQISEYYMNGILEELSGKEINETTAKKLVKLQQAMFEEIIAMHLGKGGVSEFSLPGLLTMKAIYKPPVKGGKMVRSPFSGEMVEQKPKEASIKIKINAMKKLKDISMEGIMSHKRTAKDKLTAKNEKAAAKEQAQAAASKPKKVVKEEPVAGKVRTTKKVVKEEPVQSSRSDRVARAARTQKNVEQEVPVKTRRSAR